MWMKIEILLPFKIIFQENFQRESYDSWKDRMVSARVLWLTLCYCLFTVCSIKRFPKALDTQVFVCIRTQQLLVTACLSTALLKSSLVHSLSAAVSSSHLFEVDMHAHF